MDIRGKAVLVTGAGTGVGKEIAKSCAGAGARVACSGRRKPQLEVTVQEIRAAGGTAMVAQMDVTDPAQVKATCAQVARELGPVQLLVNNAGRFASIGPAWEADPEEWWLDVAINLRGTMLCSQQVIPGMIEKGEGVIVNLSGGGALGPNLGGSSYGSSKAGVVRFTETLALELQREGLPILVMAIAPGFVVSEMTEALVDTPEHAKWQGWVINALKNNIGYPPELSGKAILELVSIASPELTGRLFHVNQDFSKVDHAKAGVKEHDLLTMRFVEDAGVLDRIDWSQG